MRPKIPPQIIRLILVTIAIVVSYLGARAVLTPDSFGEYGWYRGDALADIAAKPPVFAGKLSCDECHSDVVETLTKFEHKTLSCEGCHGPSQAHVEDPDKLPVKPDDKRCLRCHEADVSRPTWLRQIESAGHYAGDACISCHKPHQPQETP